MLLTGGGTGGHVYPALAVARALESAPAESDGPPEIIYVGTANGMEAEIVRKAGLPFVAVSAGAIRGRSVLGLAAGVGSLGKGLVQALRLVDQWRPDAALATGGYVCVPVVLAAWLRRVPVLVYLPDVEPGLAVKLLSKLATRIAVTSEESRRFLPARKVVETGYPVRPELWSVGRGEARARLGLPIGAWVLLVFGGSRGARTLNEATAAALPRLLELAHVVHVCGREDEAVARSGHARLPAELASRHHLFGYLHSAEMADALAAADLVVSRSGASTLGELPAVGLPAVLVPYPYAGAHQRLNAQLLASRGAAVVLENEAVRKGALLPTVESLLADPERLARMSAAARGLARPGAAEALAEALRDLADGRSRRGEVRE